ncbi:MAG: DEAD/DEAH box helicase family protein [Halomonas subglaciescola]|nr:DEAD/DEAH box helicase family protein [Halomonas subglaciescola]
MSTAKQGVGAADLAEKTWETSYRSGRNNLAADFYAPAMAASQVIQRTSGYFRSTVFALMYPQLTDFLVRGGRMELLISPYLSRDDKDALAGAVQSEARGNGEATAALTNISREAFLREVQALQRDAQGEWHHALLGGLIHHGFLDVRIALLRGGDGLFHEKMGLFHDAQGNTLSFKGSVNETYSGWGLQGNIESIDVFCSWRQADGPRVRDHQHDFNEVWENRYARVETVALDQAMRDSVIQAAPDDPEEVKAMLARYQERRRATVIAAGLDTPLPEEDAYHEEQDAEAVWPSRRVAEPHQRQALTLWEEAGRRGIFVHATGSGKTFTALHAIRDHLREVGIVLVVVPSQLLMKGWYSEIRTEIPDAHILRVGGGHDRWREPMVLEAQTASPNPRSPMAILATMQTASTPAFWKRLKKPRNLLLVADEVHQTGSQKHQQLFRINAGFRLGLSATPKRFGDPDGTEALMMYFQGMVGKPFTLADAMEAGRLTPYRYHPVTVSLNAEESEQWEELTDQLRRAIQRGPREADGSPKDSQAIRLLKIKRSRVAKKAAAKERIAGDVLEAHYEPGQHWLVYCEDQEQLKQVVQQIAEGGFPVWTYYSDMPGDLDATLADFRASSGVMVSIRCLDEGVDIPEISHAIILASSQNPRQFIQRRGRVLRKAPGKVRAEIWDALVVPPDMDKDIHGSLTRSELLRALEFADHAMNQGGDVSRLRQMASDLGLSLDDIYGSEGDGDMEEDE